MNHHYVDQAMQLHNCNLQRKVGCHLNMGNVGAQINITNAKAITAVQKERKKYIQLSFPCVHY